MLGRFNPKADIVETSFGQVDPQLLFGVARFDMQSAAAHPDWLKEARIGEHKPESEEYGISSITFRARRPFHPLRLRDAMNHALKLTGDEASPLRALVRMKGTAWLATCPELQANMALAGKVFTATPGQPWWDAVPRNRWPKGLTEDIKPHWHEPYGDRQIAGMANTAGGPVFLLHIPNNTCIMVFLGIILRSLPLFTILGK